MKSAGLLTRALRGRSVFAVLALGCAGLLGFGYYLQFTGGLEPCPLCIFQRLCYFGVAIVAIVAWIQGPVWRGRQIYAVLLALIALAGLGIAGRQTWLQNLPADRVPECGPGLEFMLEMYAPFEVLQRVLRGTGDCAKVDWTFLGFSIAEWSLACFASVLILAVLIFRSARRPGMFT